MKKRIYISGPIAGHDIEERSEAFSFVETMLESFGLEVVNPLKNGLPEDAPREQHMKKDLANLLTCDYIYQMVGWACSKGSIVEASVAESLGIEVYANEDFPNGIRGVEISINFNFPRTLKRGTHYGMVKNYIDSMQEEEE